MILVSPDKLIGDRAHDSDKLDEDGIDMIAPYQKGHKPAKTQDGRKLSRYERRRLVERFFAWLH